MEVIPVIDLKSGQVVHARGGARDGYRPIETPLAAGSAPRDVVAGLLALAPFRRLYVADLDAIERRGDHADALTGLAAEFPRLEFWIDAGIATREDAQKWLDRPRCCPVLGSESQTDIETVRSLATDSRAILSLDFRGDAFQGPPRLRDDARLWPARIIVMTLARIGADAGPDFDRVAEIARAGASRTYAAGGVRNAADLDTLAAHGTAGALVASALHAGTITARDLATLTR
jgi:phosphoribosylformimino-5-aminoimidazole carboxamide ribotide isomerase